MKEIENRLFLYGKTRVKHVILDKWLRTGGDVDYEWQAKLLMHEILSQPLRQTQSNFVGMLANAIADQKDGFEPHFEVYCKLYDCMTKAKEEVREMLDSIEEERSKRIEHKSVKPKNRQPSGWISLDDGLPDEFEEVLVTDGSEISIGVHFKYGIEESGWDIKGWGFIDDSKKIINFWKYLPELPKE